MNKKSEQNILTMIDELLILQEELNIETNGINWKTGINKYDKTINWYRCISQEIGEFIDSFPWKHWKNISIEVDLDNAKIELVDVLHFLLSLMLVELEIDKKSGIVDTFEKFNNFYKDTEVEKDNEMIIRAAEKLQNIVTALDYSGTHDKEFSLPAKDEKLERTVSSFIQLTYLTGLKFEEMYSLYLGKNVLNKFRQKNGYKEGTYVKKWLFNGTAEEDNVVMYFILREFKKNNQIFTASSLYEALSDAYCQ